MTIQEEMTVQLEKIRMDEFFRHLKVHAEVYRTWTSEVPRTLVVHPDIIAQLSRIEGFYQREELMAQVTSHSPMVRHFKLPAGVVFIREDVDEKFFHFE